GSGHGRPPRLRSPAFGHGHPPPLRSPAFGHGHPPRLPSPAFGSVRMGESGFRSAAVFLCVAADFWSAFSPRPAFPPRAGLSRSPGPPPQSSPPRSHTRPGGRSVVSVVGDRHSRHVHTIGAS